MRRRLTLTIVLLTVGTLLVSGVVTLLLTVYTARQQTRREITQAATALARSVQTETAGSHGDIRALRLRRVLATLKGPLHLQGSAVVTLNAKGQLELRSATGARQPLPDGLVPGDIDVAALVAGDTVSGTTRSLIYAATPLTLDYRKGNKEITAREVVVLVRQAPTGLATALPWLLLSSAGVLIVAVLVGDRLARRTVRPLRTAEEVTARIAAGDLSARVGDDPGDDVELRNLGASINSMAVALATAKGTQRQFLLSVSHELRTPLTSIQGFAEALEDGTATDVPRAAAIIAAESRRLGRLVGDLLELARLDTGRFSLRPSPVRLSDVVAESVAAFEPAAADLGLSLHAAVDTVAVDILADPDRLTQVVSNLVENALNYAAAGVHVGASTATGAAVIWVDDDGPGVAAADLPHIFTRLFSSAERPGRRVGTGLGLAIVVDLVASMGGHIRAESPLPSTAEGTPGGGTAGGGARGGGTRVLVTLPLTSPDAAPSDGRA